MQYYIINFTILISISLLLLQFCFSNYSISFGQEYEDDPSYSLNFLRYSNLSKSIEIDYPSFWNVVESTDPTIVSFLSPVSSIGVSIQSKPVVNVSSMEILMGYLEYMKSNFDKLTFSNISIDLPNANDQQSLVFTYGNDTNIYQVLLYIMAKPDRSYTFTYYADRMLFDKFLSVSLKMLNSSKIIDSHNILENKTGTDISSSVKYKDSKINNYVSVLNHSINDEENVTGYKSYKKKDIGIELRYPAFLNLVEKDFGIILSTNDRAMAVVIVNIPLENTSLENFSIRNIMTLNKTLSNFNIINSSTSNLLGEDTQMLLFNYTNGTHTYNAMQFWKLSEKYANIFTYFGQSNSVFNSFLPSITKIIETLRFSQ